MNPVWIKDRKTGKYERIPYEKMTLQKNGKYVIGYYQAGTTAGRFLEKYPDYFTHSINMDGFIFLGKRNRAARNLKWHQRAMAALAGYSIVTAAACFYNGEITVGFVACWPPLMLLGTLWISRRAYRKTTTGY